MSETFDPAEQYKTMSHSADRPVSITYTSFDVTPAERNLLLRLRQHRGMMIIDADSMCLWAAGRIEQCNGKRPATETRLPFPMDFA